MGYGNCVHGVAVPFNEWIDFDAPSDDASTPAVRFLPGAFAEAIRRSPRSRVTIDHIVTRAEYGFLFQDAGGGIDYWEERDGLHFEARGVCDRIHDLVQAEVIRHVCLELPLPFGAPFVGKSIDVVSVPCVGDLAVILFTRPHTRAAWVRAGRARDRRPTLRLGSRPWSATATQYRVVARVEAPGYVPSWRRVAATCEAPWNH